MVRWWNGIGWSDVATPAGPGVAVQSSPVLAPPARPAPEALPPPVAPDSGNRTPWIVGIALLVLVAVVGAALFLGTSDSTPIAADPTAATGQPPPPAGPTFPPGTVR